MAWATLDTISGKAVLSFERRLAHPPEKVFRAISDPAELRHWFPATVEFDLRAGAAVRFTFEEHDIGELGGEVLEVDPPRLLVYSWNDDVLRWEVVPDGDGSRLLFSQTLAEGRSGSARNAAGWDVCLAGLGARLDGEQAAELEWFPRFEAYAERFGLGEGSVRETGDGVVLRFERDVVQPPPEVWAFLTQGTKPEVGATAPRRFSPAPPGAVSAVEPERMLAFERVRWTLEPSMPGSLIVVEEILPEVRPRTAAAWQVHMELLVAGLAGIPRAWPEDRVERLTERYFSAAGHAMR
jgi:uncharacterized protein YndB with AHSA1/START domain